MPETAKPDFTHALATLFDELGSHWHEQAPEQMVVADERLRDELLLPNTAPARICFFSLPPALVGFYRANVFPVVDELGLVPAAGDEMIGRSGNVRTFLDLLLDRSVAVIVDTAVDTPRARSDLNRAQANPKVGRAGTAIVREGDPPSETSSPDDVMTFYRPPLTLAGLTPAVPGGADWKDWISNLRLWLHGRRTLVTQHLRSYTVSLLETEDYDAAVISAARTLEVAMRDLEPSRAAVGATPVAGDPLSTLMATGTLSEPDRAQVDRLQILRNVVAHSHDKVSQDDAEEVVQYTLELLERLDAKGRQPPPDKPKQGKKPKPPRSERA